MYFQLLFEYAMSKTSENSENAFPNYSSQAGLFTYTNG